MAQELGWQESLGLQTGRPSSWRAFPADVRMVASAGQGTDRAAGFIKPWQGVPAVGAQRFVSARSAAKQAGPWQQLPQKRAAHLPEALPGRQMRQDVVRFFHVEALSDGMLNDE